MLCYLIAAQDWNINYKKKVGKVEQKKVIVNVK